MNEAVMKFKEWVTDLVYPPRCPFCHRVAENRWGIPCPKCAAELTDARKTPARIQMEKHHFYVISGAASLYCYHHPKVNQAILSMKAGQPWYAASFARLMARELFLYDPKSRSCRQPVALEYDCIVPVPDSKRGKGYWIPGIMAKELSRLTGLPLEDKALVKIKVTPKQAGLSREERLTNLIGAFQVVRPERIEGKRVLLVDDIITTGSTVSCCAQALVQGGAREVSGLSIAVAEREKNQ